MTEQAPNLSEQDKEQLEKYPDTVTDKNKAEIMAYAGKEAEEKVVELSKQAAQRLVDATPSGYKIAALDNMGNHAPFPVEKELLKVADDFEEIKEARAKADRIEGTTGAIYDRVKEVTDAAKSGATLKEKEQWTEEDKENDPYKNSVVLEELHVDPNDGKVEK